MRRKGDTKMTDYFSRTEKDCKRKFTDMENPASVQAMLADICVGNCGHFEETQLTSTRMSEWAHFGTISRIYCTFGQQTNNLVYEGSIMMQFQT